jgi:hypothetical protein
MFIIVKDVNILEESELYAFQPARPLDGSDNVGLIATIGTKAVIIISK